ncbi:MAG: SsrA-binding protein SmpB [Phycisphaerae bacterium]|nr:SsrA-binding protein SmpB [Phycisphaerae bacterium]
MAKKTGKPSSPESPRVSNRKARHEYHIHDRLECGIVLSGTEVKAIREGRATISDAFARVEPETNELWLYNLDIGGYAHAAPATQHEPKRRRKLLAHRKQIRDLLTQTHSKGMTLVPLSLYFNNRGLAKIELAVASGKGGHDKRATVKEKDARRDMQRGLTRKRIG